MSQFINILSKINDLIILDTYEAGEKPIKGATSKDIYNHLLKINQNVIYLKNIKYLNKSLLKYTMEKNTIIFMGAGSVTNIAKKYYNS